MENFETYKLDQTGQQTQAILDQVSTNTADIAQLRALYEALTQSEPVIIQPSDTWPVADPQENVIYRVIDRVNTPPQYYSDYMWNGTAMVLMATYNNSIDNEPTPGSNNLVKSGGVAASIVFDISAYHATGSTLATYADLAAALGTDGANVPASVRKGGMSVKFVNSSDNKYVQYRLMANEWSTTVTDWQGVDDVPTAGSDNLVKSWGVAQAINKPLKGFISTDNRYNKCIISFSFDVNSNVGYQNELYLYMFGVFADNKKFYVGIFDSTQGGVVGYAVTDETFNTIPTSGIRTFTFTSLSGNRTTYQASNVTITIDWSYYDSSMWLMNEWSKLIRVWAGENVAGYIQNSQKDFAYIKKGFVSTDERYNNFIKDIVFEAPSGIVGHQIVVNMLGIFADNKKFYVGLYDRTESRVVGYQFTDEVFNSIPASGAQTFLFPAFSFGNASYTVKNVKITVDWAYYTSDMWLNSQNTPISLEFNLDNIIAQESKMMTFSEIIANKIYKLENDCILNSSVIVPDNTIIDLNGYTVFTNIDNNLANITIGNNSAIINGKFVGHDGYSKGRTLNPPLYTYTPIIDNYQYQADYVDIYSLDSVVLIKLSGNNARVKDCTFIDYGGTCILCNNSTGQVNNDRVLVDGCSFNFCYCGINNTGEFNRFANCHFSGNLIGMISEAGNFVFTNNIIKMCDIGVVITDNGNGGHSEIVATKFAHCIRGMQFPSGLLRVLGLVVTGSEFADAPIQGYGIGSLLLSGCRLDSWFEANTGGYDQGSCAAVGNIVRDAYADRDVKPIFNGFEYLKNNIPMVITIPWDEINN